MRRKLGFKPSLRDTVEANERALRAMMPDGKLPQDMQRVFDSRRLPPKRVQAPRRDLEGPVVTAISELLAVHPKVLFAVRQNSGAAQGGDSYVQFYRIITRQPVTITDFWGFLRDGSMLAVEAKAPGWKEPKTKREFEQAAFLSLVRNCGGISLFADDVQQVADALK